MLLLLAQEATGAERRESAFRKGGRSGVEMEGQGMLIVVTRPTLMSCCMKAQLAFRDAGL